MTPLEVARRMMRANCDPGLIAAYLRLELEADPTLGMTPIQRLGYAARLALRGITRAFAPFESVVLRSWDGRVIRRVDYTLAGPSEGGAR